MAVVTSGPLAIPRRDMECSPPPNTLGCCWEGDLGWGGPWVMVGSHTSGMGLFSLPWLPSWWSLALRLPWERRSQGEKATSCGGQKRLGFAPEGWGGGLGLPWGRGGLDPALGLGEGVLCGLTGGDWGVPWLGDTHPVSP